MSNTTLAGAPPARQTFGYDANMPMAWIGGISFTLLFLVHISQYFHYRAYYLWMFMVGLSMELCGYWTRVYAIQQPTNAAAATSSWALVTLAPSVIAAAGYMTFGRMIYWVSPEEKRTFRYIWAPVKWITTFFVSWDLGSFLVAAIGMLVLLATVTKQDLSSDQQLSGMQATYIILRVAFVWQVVVFAIFTLFAFRFMFAAKAWRYDWPEAGSGQWRKVGWMVNAVSLLITGRALFRCLEFTLNGGDNYLRVNEWTFYMFDFVPMIAAVSLLSILHPGRFMPKEYMTFRHGYKKPGFRNSAAPIKETAQPVTAGYSRVTLVPPPLVPPSSRERPQNDSASVAFTDPWNNRSSLSAARFQ